MLYIIYILLESALGEPDHYKYNVYKSKNKLKKVNHWSVRLVHIVRFFVFRKTENILGSLWTLILSLKHDTMQFVIKKCRWNIWKINTEYSSYWHIDCTFLGV